MLKLVCSLMKGLSATQANLATFFVPAIGTNAGCYALFVLDSRKQVVEKWRSVGLTAFQVTEGNFRPMIDSPGDRFKRYEQVTSHRCCIPVQASGRDFVSYSSSKVGKWMVNRILVPSSMTTSGNGIDRAMIDSYSSADNGCRGCVRKIWLRLNS